MSDPVRIVVVSDLHFDKDTLGVPRMPEVCAALHQAVEYAIEIDAAALLCLGDISDPDIGGAASLAPKHCAAAALRLEHHEIHSVWIAGNHDVYEDGSGATTLSPIVALDSGTGCIHVVERPAFIDIAHRLAIACLPFTAVSHAYDPDVAYTRMTEEAAKRKEPPAIIVAAHLTIPGVEPGEETTDMPRGRDVVFPFEATRGALARLNGHYHRRQVFDPEDGGPPIHIPGAPARFAFGEEGNDPGFLVLTVEP
ncbi:MAG: nuclease SbcCD, subunit [Labilithrix sp.]|nr:nuclease SbcCD, subunit [Labilithrix sp.]